jgi:hypothetical protein
MDRPAEFTTGVGAGVPQEKVVLGTDIHNRLAVALGGAVPEAAGDVLLAVEAKLKDYDRLAREHFTAEEKDAARRFLLASYRDLLSEVLACFAREERHHLKGLQAIFSLDPALVDKLREAVRQLDEELARAA